MVQWFNADVSDTILATSHQERHPVAWVDFPRRGCNIQKPSLRNESIKYGEHHFLIILLFRQRHSGTYWCSIFTGKICLVIDKMESFFVFGKDTTVDIIHIDSCLFHTISVFTGPRHSPNRASTSFTLSILKVSFPCSSSLTNLSPTPALSANST